MDLVARLLLKSLRATNPQLDLLGSDRRVLFIACKDFTNYLRVHWKLTGKESAGFKLREEIHSYFHEKPQEFEEFANLWSRIWIKKWNERIKIILTNEDQQRSKRIDKLLSKAEPVWRRLKSRNKIKEIVIEALIRNGEICGTSILAEDMLKIELGSFVERKAYTDERELLLGVVNNVLRKARKVSQSKGPLILIRIDKRFFQLLEKDTT